jgi:hypothetical protein
LFQFNFRFRDIGIWRADGVVQENPVYKGMHTVKDRAVMLDELTVFLTDRRYRNLAVIVYGEIPAIPYALGRPCAIGSSWADLQSYPLGDLHDDLENIANDTGKALPLIIINAQVYKSAESLRKDEKGSLIMDFMNQENYEAVFKNGQYLVYARLQ